DTRTAELGIACEACHGPAERHLKAHESPLHRVIARRQDHADPTIFNPGRADHVKSAEACGQCHAIRHNRHLDQWHQHGVQFQPGGDLEARAPLVHYDGTDLEVPGNEKKRALMEGSFWSDGQVRVSGREFNGLAATACFTRGQMSCLSCHSLHHYQDTDDQLGRGMDGNQACLQCHDSIGKNLTRHTHHPTGSSGSLCYNCHMPHTSYGLLKAIRSHTIDSPTVATSVKTGRPNACNLCHLDRSLGWTQRHLEEWYGTPKVTLSAEEETLSAAVLWLLKGDAGQRALLAWHLGWPTARAVSGTNWLVPFLAETLTDPYAVVRYIGERSLKSIPGFEQLVYDYVGPATERQRARQQILDAWRKAPRPVDAPSGTVLLEASGAMQEGAIRALLRQRNHRKMELLE
ncbi:MAG TPA: C cytochrome precursor, partial [Methylomirabilota bacterium]|nr:C cytochrome precursor [Methylomirabilota bacterium]